MLTWGFLWEALIESMLDLFRRFVPDAGYHPALAGTPPEEGNWNYLGGLFLTPLYHGSAELAERPTSLQGRARRGENAIFTASLTQAEIPYTLA